MAKVSFLPQWQSKAKTNMSEKNIRKLVLLPFLTCLYGAPFSLVPASSLSLVLSQMLP